MFLMRFWMIIYAVNFVLLILYIHISILRRAFGSEMNENQVKIKQIELFSGATRPGHLHMGWTHARVAHMTK